MSSPTTTPPTVTGVDPVAAICKAILLNGACTLAGDAAAPTGKIDPTIQDPALQGLNNQDAQEVKIFYNFLRSAFENQGTDPDGVTKNGWAFPAVPGSHAGGAPAPGTNLLGLIQWLSTQPPTSFAGLPQVAIDALNKLVAQIGQPQQPPSVAAGS